MPEQVRVRIAPSPTGTLHLGTARTGLYNYLFARQRGGSFVVRIEDTDRERSTEAFERSILDDLRWLGLTWDEGPDVGGPFAPYRQSERSSHHAAALAQLIDAGRAFRTRATHAELAAWRTECQRVGKPVRYQSFAGKGTGESAVIIFPVPAGDAIVFPDEIRGTITTSREEIDDFIIATDDGARVLYNFAAVVDDAQMRITHVIRGEDHISNTPKQLLLYDALGVPAPAFAHVPLILDSQRAKLSKRAGAVSVAEYREQGFLPAAVLNYLALLGWNPKTTDEIFALDELVKLFNLGQVHRGGAVFDLTRIRWMNATFIRRLPIGELDALTTPFVAETFRKLDDDYRQRILEVARTRMEVLTELPTVIDAFIGERDLTPALLCWKTQTSRGAADALALTRRVVDAIPVTEFTVPVIERQLRSAIASNGQTNGEVLWPLRVSLSGREKSPSPFEMLWALGKPESLRRIEEALSLLKRHATP